MENTNNISKQLSETEFYILSKTDKHTAGLETAEEIAEEITAIVANMDNFPSFGDGLTDLIMECGYCGDLDSHNEKKQYLYQRIINSGANVNEFPTDETLGNWFKGKTIPSTDKDRLYIQQICLVLECSLEQTENFFRKIFLGMPFNFRNAEECICYFCIKNGKSYQEFQNLKIQLAESPHSHTEVTSSTAVIRHKFSEEFKAGDEQKMLEYLIESVPEPERYYYTARKHIKTLTDRCIPVAKQLQNEDPAKEDARREKQSNTDKARAKRVEESEAARKKAISENPADTTDNGKYKGVNSLMAEIYGFQTDTSRCPEMKRSFDKKLPKAFIRNFPKHHQIDKVLRESDIVSSEMLRKCLILLKFYFGYGKSKIEKRAYSMERFVKETNTLLNECGFQELYVRNQYDFIFFYCAYYTDKELKKSPEQFGVGLTMFQALMDEMHDNST